MSLTRAEVDHYEREGWIAPIDVMSEVEASDLAAELEQAEAAHPADLNPQHRNNAHLAFPFLAEVVTRRAIVSAVNSLVGDDVAPTGLGQIRKFAVNSTFGQTAQVEIKAGPGDINNVRESVILQTPAANSLVYNELDPS